MLTESEELMAKLVSKIICWQTNMNQDNQTDMGPNQSMDIYDPGSGLGMSTDRDQPSWVFLNDPKILCH